MTLGYFKGVSQRVELLADVAPTSHGLDGYDSFSVIHSFYTRVNFSSSESGSSCSFSKPEQVIMSTSNRVKIGGQIFDIVSTNGNQVVCS